MPESDAAPCYAKVLGCGFEITLTTKPDLGTKNLASELTTDPKLQAADLQNGTEPTAAKLPQNYDCGYG